MTLDYKKIFIINVLYFGTVLAIVVLVSKYMLAYVFPFVIGVGIALAVQKPSQSLADKLKIKRQICSVILTVFICAATLTALALLFWLLGGKLASLVSKAPGYIAEFQKSFNDFKGSIIKKVGTTGKNSIEKILSGAAESLVSGIISIVSGIAAELIKNLPAFLIGSIVTIVASCYIAKDFDRLKKFVRGIISEDRVEKIKKLKNILTGNTVKFIKGYGIIAAITFIELSAALAILGVKKPILKAFLISLVDALPVLGIGSIIVPWAVVELFKNNFYLGFGLIISYALIVIIRNFIEPKIIGEQIGINPLFTLISMFLGLKIAGITGVILFPLSLTVAVEYYRKTA